MLPPFALDGSISVNSRKGARRTPHLLGVLWAKLTSDYMTSFDRTHVNGTRLGIELDKASSKAAVPERRPNKAPILKLVLIEQRWH
jgi:hypothetical protein